MNNPTPNPKANAACKVHTSVRMVQRRFAYAGLQGAL